MLVIPVLSRPSIPPAPVPPELTSQLPKDLVVTPADVALYTAACDAWESGEYSDDQVIADYGLTRTAACDWAIYGYTVQDSITFDGILTNMVGYINELQNHNKFLHQIIDNMYEVSQQTNESVREINSK